MKMRILVLYSQLVETFAAIIRVMKLTLPGVDTLHPDQQLSLLPREA